MGGPSCWPRKTGCPCAMASARGSGVRSSCRAPASRSLRGAPAGWPWPNPRRWRARRDASWPDRIGEIVQVSLSAADGTPAGRVVLPEGMRLLAADPGRVLFVRRVSLDVPSVEVWRLLGR